MRWKIDCEAGHGACCHAADVISMSGLEDEYHFLCDSCLRMGRRLGADFDVLDITRARVVEALEQTLRWRRLTGDRAYDRARQLIAALREHDAHERLRRSA